MSNAHKSEKTSAVKTRRTYRVPGIIYYHVCPPIIVQIVSISIAELRRVAVIVRVFTVVFGQVINSPRLLRSIQPTRTYSFRFVLLYRCDSEEKPYSSKTGYASHTGSAFAAASSTYGTMCMCTAVGNGPSGGLRHHCSIVCSVMRSRAARAACFDMLELYVERYGSNGENCNPRPLQQYGQQQAIALAANYARSLPQQ